MRASVMVILLFMLMGCHSYLHFAAKGEWAQRSGEFEEFYFRDVNGLTVRILSVVVNESVFRVDLSIRNNTRSNMRYELSEIVVFDSTYTYELIGIRVDGRSFKSDTEFLLGIGNMREINLYYEWPYQNRNQPRSITVVLRSARMLPGSDEIALGIVELIPHVYK